MVCKNCEKNPVMNLPNSKIRLCKSCFIKYFERKAFKTISKHKLLENNDNELGIAVSGGKDSFALLYILNRFAEKKRNLNLKVICVDEGIKGYRNLSEIKKFCKKNSIEIHVYSFKKEFGMTLNQIVKKTNMRPCSVCGVLRRLILNSKARDLGLKKIATGHNLDDEAQSILMNQFRGNIERSARLGPLTGVVSDKRFVKRIKPFYFLTEEETGKYAQLRKLVLDKGSCPYSKKSYRGQVKAMLNKFTEKHKQTKHAIVNSFMSILPLLKKEYAGAKIKGCKECGEPCSRDICKACDFLEKINQKGF